jgi:hypothetical protein
MPDQENQPTDIVLGAESVALIPTTDVQGRVDAMLANRGYLIEKVKPMLIEGVDIYRLPGMKKDSLGKPGAEKLAAIFGLTAKFEVDRDTMDMIGKEANGKPYIAYICNVSRSGRVAGQGRGATFIEWQRNSYRMVFNQPTGTPEKDGWRGPFTGTSKSTGRPYTFWKVPEAPVFDPLALNKAIKMAQKSAFVDAVIRTTGMSDLFTQDLEDAGDATEAHEPVAPEAQNAPVSQAKPVDETFPDNGGYVATAAKLAADAGTPAGDVPPLCGLCGAPMKKRTGARGPFWGCSTYPKCTNILNI